MNNTEAGDWWKEAIIYEVWPKSFYSGKGASCGDILGLISKLGYVKSLGINTIWLAPHYTSVCESSPRKGVEICLHSYCISCSRWWTKVTMLLIMRESIQCLELWKTLINSSKNVMTRDFESSLISSLIIQVINTSGLKRADVQKIIQNQIGISGSQQSLMTKEIASHQSE